jgi:hypothetical protein
VTTHKLHSSCLVIIHLNGPGGSKVVGLFSPSGVKPHALQRDIMQSIVRDFLHARMSVSGAILRSMLLLGRVTV